MNVDIFIEYRPVPVLDCWDVMHKIKIITLFGKVISTNLCTSCILEAFVHADGHVQPSYIYHGCIMKMYGCVYTRPSSIQFYQVSEEIDDYFTLSLGILL